MNEFTIELFIDNHDEEYIAILNLDNTELQPWKSDIEAKALSEYYKRKIIISEQKFLI